MADHNEPLVKPELISSSTGLSPRCIHDTTASVSISIKTLSKKLKNMVQVYISKRENVSKLETFLFTLKSRRLRSLSSSLEFLSSGGVDSLLELARSLAKDNEKESSLLNLVWGTIANVCSFDKKIQQKVAVSAIPDICETLSKCVCPKVLNTVCRTIGNIYSSLATSTAYRHGMFVQEITRIFLTYKDSGCLQSALRTIRKLSSTGTINEDLRMARTIPAIVICLNIRDRDVSVAALKSLDAMISSSDGDYLISQLWSPDIAPLRMLVDSAQVDDGILDNMVIVLLCKCVQHMDGKASVSRAGGIDLLVKYFMGCSKDSDLYLTVLDSLCLCCRDVHGRQKIRDLNGLQMLIDIVQEDSLSSYHENVFSALICYYFDEHTLRHMVMKLNLMKSLVHHLSLFSSKLSCEETNNASSSSIITRNVPFDDPSSVDSDVDIDAPSPDHHSPSTTPSDDESECSSVVSTVTSQPIISTKSPPTQQQQSTTNATSVSFSDEFLQSCLSHPVCNLSSPSSRQASIDIDMSDSMPVDYIDSVLASPSLSYSNIASTNHSSSIPLLGSDNGDCVEGKVLLLVSRVSHLHDCQPVLATCDIFPAILQYFFASHGHNRSQIFKVLSKIFMNPLCFQDCLINHAASLLFMHFKTEEGSLQSCSSSSPATHSSLSKDLFDMLSHVARLPYGQGVIAHMLLRGDDKHVTAGTLALALLEKSPTVCYRMLTTDGYVGLHNLICLSQGIEGASQIEDDRLIKSAMIVLLNLAHSFHVHPPRKRRYSSMVAEDSYDYYSPSVKKPKSHPCSTPLKPIALESSMSDDTSQSCCMYGDTDHLPFDLRISVSNGCGESCVFPVHRAVFVESSDVFSVMLEGSYQESHSNEVQLHNLEPSVFRSVVHFVYGCQLPCIDASGSSSTCDDSICCPIAHSLIQDIIQPIDSSDDRHSVYHWLLLLEYANRFNIPSLVYRCEESLKLFVLESNLVSLFQYSIMMNDRPVARQCIVKLISLCHVHQQCIMMRELLNSGDAPSFIEILQEFFHV